MAKFDRSKFKTSNSLAQQEKELSTIIKSNNFSGTPGWIEIKEDGEYLLRFWPTPVENSYFMLPTMVHFLNMELDKYKDGELELDSAGNPIREVRKGTVFNSRIHGDTTKDIVEEYIAFVEKQADDLYPSDKEKKKDYLKNIYGYNAPGGKYVGGITGSLDYVAYVSLLEKNNKGEYIQKEFGRVKLRPSIRKQMLKLSAGEDGGDLTADPFSDPDEGFIVKITKDSVAGKKDPANYYGVTWCTQNFIPVKWPLPEGFEEKYDEMPTLVDLYKGKYTIKEFNNALDGLQRFDGEHKYNAFSFDDFMNICEEVANYYPDTDDQESSQQQQSTQRSIVEEIEEVEEVVEEVVEEIHESPFEEPSPAVVTPQAVTGTLTAAEKLAAMKAKIAGK